MWHHIRSLIIVKRWLLSAVSAFYISPVWAQASKSKVFTFVSRLTKGRSCRTERYILTGLFILCDDSDWVASAVRTDRLIPSDRLAKIDTCDLLGRPVAPSRSMNVPYVYLLAIWYRLIRVPVVLAKKLTVPDRHGVITVKSVYQLMQSRGFYLEQLTLNGDL